MDKFKADYAAAMAAYEAAEARAADLGRAAREAQAEFEAVARATEQVRHAGWALKEAGYL